MVRKHYLCGDMLTHIYIIGIGSNLPYAECMVHAICSLLPRQVFGQWRFSRCMLTEPIRFANPALFANAVAEVQTSVDAGELHRLLKAVEALMGRCPADKSESRVVADLDILVADSSVLRPADMLRPYITTLLAEIGYEALQVGRDK